MNPRIEKIRGRIDELSIRERAAMFGVLVVVLVLGWNELTVKPVARQQQDMLAKITETQKQVSEIEQLTENLAASRAADPNAENRRALEELNAAMAGLDTQIRGTVSGLVEPRQMAHMLEDVLTRNPGLKLKKAQSLPATPLVAAEEGTGGTVFKHGLRLELEGSYLDALAYLRALQKLPRAIYWDEVRVEMTKYPTAHITIVVHTLSLSEGWIGA